MCDYSLINRDLHGVELTIARICGRRAIELDRIGRANTRAKMRAYADAQKRVQVRRITGVAMSWDVSLHKFSQRYRAVGDIPDNEQPSDLGSLEEVRAFITSVFPETDWTDPHWGSFDSEIGSIEFSVGKDDPVQSIGLHVRAGDAIVDGILLLCEQMDCQAIDFSDGSFLEQSDDPASGLRKWRAYRDQILNQAKTS